VPSTPLTPKTPSTPKTPKGRFRALAFTGGYDAVVQLGLVHALLVSSGRAPDAVVGVSGGAVNAAALAEILQAGDGDPQAQVDQLRKFLDSYLKIPGEILRSILPDAFEINAVKPLKPIELPIHFQEEREDRNGASRSRWGLSYALNELFGLRLTVRHLTRVTNCALEIVAAANLAPVARLWKRVKYLGILWYLSPRFVVLAPLVGQLLFAATAGSTRGQHGVTAGKLLWHPTRRGWMGWRVLPNVWSYLQMLFLSVLWVFSGLAPLLALLSLVAIADFFILFSASRALGFLSHHIVPLPKVWGVFMPDLLRSTTWLWNGIRAVWQLRVVHLYSVFWGLALLLIVLTFVVPPFRRWRRAGFRKVLDRTLEYLDLNHGLGNTYALKQQLINCFDREYYGKIEIEEVLKRASNGTPEALEPNPKRPKKTLGDYCNGTPPIQVGAVAADVKTGDLSVLGGDVPVVDALLAATAYVPVFPAVEIAPTGLLKRFFIDAGNISREAIGPLLDFIRNEEKLDDFAVVDVYPVHRLLPKPEAGAEAAAPNLIKEAFRALQLQRLRDAKIEQRLTRLFGKVLPTGAGRVWVAGRPFVRAEVYPLEVETQASLGGSMLRKSSLELREVVYQEIADGCRAALEGMIPEAIGKAEKSLSDKTQPWTSPLAVPCREAIKSRRADPLPGSTGSPGPGLSEICERCVLRQPSGFDLPQHLKVPTKKRREWPEWPLKDPPPVSPVPVDLPDADIVDAVAVPSPARPPLPMEKTAEWPLTRHGLAGPQRPLVSLLFGGGVFRGVFHMGVLNALNELEITPDLVAGSSVGSIVAAMIAQAFTLNDPKLRRAQIARLAATFLAIDQLVLSDRMADFVRGFTVRAGDTHFSPRDLDLSLRRYDFDGSASFSRRMRNVAAGIERLLYLSPADFLQLVEAGRTRRSCDLIRQLEAAVQKFLARSGVGQEILGAEPLALLIRTHVIEQLALPKDQTALFSSFIDKGIYFLATTTNLTQGELEILGDRSAHGEVLLLEGLLASSAFPAIFRPREGWEVFRNSSTQDRYFDGGIMDNLPLDAVAEFLFEKNGDIARRPRIAGRPVPHLLFTASLEVDKQALPDDRVENVSRSFLRLRKRAKTFIYNRKIDAYAKVQRDLRTIYEDLSTTGKATSWKPLDLHLVAVKPQWLCDTFGFHPMLGFRRRKQAQSIAHGCASTLAQLYVEQTRNPAWSAGWGIRGLDRMDPQAVLLDADRFTLVPRRKNKAAGECWFRNAVACPFSPASLAELSIEKETAEQLGKIYEYCGQVETHRPSHGRAAV
jgi:predicted acylesterase/phospholipase RssA